MVRTWLLLLLATALAGACGRTGTPRGTAAGRAAPVEADAIARDRAPSIVMPLAPAGAGEWSVERVAPARAELDLPPPPAEPAAPDSVPTAAPEPAPDALKPPIARGLPRILQAGGGGRVTLDVRVDEQGEVSDVELVAGDADTVTIAAATAAAFATRYHPARLGGRAVAVWSRQVFDVRRGRDR